MKEQQHMKTLVILTVLLVTISAVVSAQSADSAWSLTLKYPQYTLSACTSAANGASFIVAMPDTGTSGFAGLSYKEDVNNLGKTPVLDILDGATGKLIKSVNAAEYFGLEDSSWKADSAASSTSASGVTSAFTVKAGKKTFDLIRTVETVADANLPLGKSLRVGFAVKSKLAMSVKVKFYGNAFGTVAAKAGGFWISGPAQTLVFHLSASTVVLGAAAKGASQGVTATGAAVKVAAGKSADVLSLTVMGTSVTNGKYVAKQAANLQKYAETKKAGAPVLVNTMVPSRTSTSVGDTVTYTLYYDNIGLSPAADISVSDPLDAHLSYVDGSAAGAGAEVTFDKTPGTPPAKDRVTKINWKFGSPILPGEERVASFKAILQ
jgi:uncharacterized repeat protein (TIGR01451 family)